VRADRLHRGVKARSIALLTMAWLAATPAAAQKSGGILRLYHNDNPPSASLLEESTIASVTPFAAVFNNLVVFDPSKVHESIETVIPDLAESWSWDATNTKLTFKLRQGVKWHDGKPFTAKDVQCTWRMLIGKSDVQDFRRNPRRVWYTKLQDVTVNGDYEATFDLSEPQPSLPVLRARFRRFIHATFRNRRCARGRSARGRSNSSNSNAETRFAWCAIPTTGKRTVLISMRSRSR
jgi:peptide/nickel transport system substrate-binding protein